MKTPGRYVNAFIKAMMMTLRGERIPTQEERLTARAPVLAGWMAETIRLAELAREAAAGQGINMVDFVMHIEKRDVSMDTILKAVIFHARQEYPSLLLSENEYARLALKATNMNDAFLVRRLADNPDLPPALKPMIEALHEHLATVPSEQQI
jgi:hypothetical protein